MYSALLVGIVAFTAFAFWMVWLLERPTSVSRSLGFGIQYANVTSWGEPVVFQRASVDCGAAAVANVLAFYGRSVPLSAIEENAVITPRGMDIHEVARVLRQFNLYARIARLPLHPRTPFIALRNHHYVAVVPRPGGSEEIVDPWFGDYTDKTKSFLRVWKGSAIVTISRKALAE